MNVFQCIYNKQLQSLESTCTRMHACIHIDFVDCIEKQVCCHNQSLPTNFGNQNWCLANFSPPCENVYCIHNHLMQPHTSYLPSQAVCMMKLKFKNIIIVVYSYLCMTRCTWHYSYIVFLAALLVSLRVCLWLLYNLCHNGCAN